MDKVLLSSKYNDWCTPDWLFEYLDNEFHFILDAAADDINHKCELFYTKEKSGLDHSWNIGGNVFCNPPYGRNIDKWVKKAFDEWHSGCSDIVLLIPARTDTNYFHDYILPYAEIRFLRGRIRFVDPRNNKSGPASFPSMIVIYRKKK